MRDILDRLMNHERCLGPKCENRGLMCDAGREIIGLRVRSDALKERLEEAEKYLSDCISDDNPTAWDIAVMEFLQDSPC